LWSRRTAARGVQPGPLPYDEWLVIGDSLIVRCRDCGKGAWLEALDEPLPGETERSFRLAGIPTEVVAQYAEKGGRASCDLERSSREIEALLNCAGPWHAIVTCDTVAKRLLSARPYACGASTGDWLRLGFRM